MVNDNEDRYQGASPLVAVSSTYLNELHSTMDAIIHERGMRDQAMCDKPMSNTRIITPTMATTPWSEVWKEAGVSRPYSTCREAMWNLETPT